MTAISEFFTQVDLGNGVYAGFTNRFGEYLSRRMIPSTWGQMSLMTR